MPSRRAWRARPLRRGVPGLVLLAEDSDGVVAQWQAQLSNLDDATWARAMRRPFRWQDFTMWWVARRWALPRDIRLTHADPPGVPACYRSESAA